MASFLTAYFLKRWVDTISATALAFPVAVAAWWLVPRDEVVVELVREGLKASVLRQ